MCCFAMKCNRTVPRVLTMSQMVERYFIHSLWCVHLPILIHSRSFHGDCNAGWVSCWGRGVVYWLSPPEAVGISWPGYHTGAQCHLLWEEAPAPPLPRPEAVPSSLTTMQVHPPLSDPLACRSFQKVIQCVYCYIYYVTYSGRSDPIH